MYQALYRKWRPQTFDDVIGQKHITDSLRNQIASGRLSHAYLFTGIRGTGKTSCARILAKAVNCEHPKDGNPCCECASCRAIAEGTVMDIVELDAASNNGVDNVRSLREEAVFSPAMVKKRVYIIDEVHMLSTSAFNALLKILEEPPEHLLFILATTELQKVPATILSRCQRHSFRRIEAKELADYLLKVAAKENFDLTEDAASLLAGLAEGGVRDALSMLDQCSSYGKIGVDEIYAAVGLAGNRRTLELFDKICSHDAAAAVELFHSLWMEGKDPASLLKELSRLVRDILMMKLAPMHASELVYGGYEKRMLEAYTARFSARQLSSTLETLQASLGSMKDRLDPKMTAELCLISLCDEIAGNTVEGLRLKVASLEEALKNGVVVTAAAPAVEKSPVVKEQAEEQKAPEAEASPEKPEVPAEPPVSDLPAEAPSVQEKPEPAAAEPSQPAPFAGYLWAAVCERAKGLLPRDIEAILATVDGVREGDILFVETDPGFYFNRFNRPDVLEALANAASELLSSPVAVKVREKRPLGKTRSLDELRQYPEVRFI
ncbi:MAG: DNA polymerase III subunit gamma/tau [Oscillospiraceae bacterium]|nr:DNA polymerase III subunit gamma/tau [Oscillospiraceae bacterium]